MRNIFASHLYVRIWLAVVGGVVILTLMATWLVRMAATERERYADVPREVTVLDAQDRPSARARRAARPAPAA